MPALRQPLSLLYWGVAEWGCSGCLRTVSKFSIIKNHKSLLYFTWKSRISYEFCLWFYAHNRLFLGELMRKTVAIDIEAYEHNRWCVLEIGLAVRLSNILRFIIAQHRQQRPIATLWLGNTCTFVTDFMSRTIVTTNFLSGHSEIVSLTEAARSTCR